MCLYVFCNMGSHVSQQFSRKIGSLPVKNSSPSCLCADLQWEKKEVEYEEENGCLLMLQVYDSST